MQKYFIQTYGCQMNYSDSERMETYLRALGFTKTEEVSEADIVLLNTCSIKQKAEDKALGKMKEISGLEKNPTVIITGCMVRISSSKYSQMRDPLFPRIKELDIALKTEELPKLAKLIREVKPNTKIEEIEEERLESYLQIKASHKSYKTKSQAFVAISNGCDKFCTYCIVPYSRGREKSRKLEDILQEARELVEKGSKEITLLGQTVNSYGLSVYDKENKTFTNLEKEPFVHLLEELDKLKEKGLERVRFTSPHPKDMSEQLIEAMATLETQMPYVHLPLQSGDNDTLKRMNRPYTIEKYAEVIKRLRAKIPDISVSTDIIVGFCGETEDEFKNTVDRFKEFGFEHAYISKYSERKGTTANRFMKDNIPREVKSRRWRELNKILIEQSEKSLKRFIGRTVKVLVEDRNGKICTGRDENFKTVQFESDKNPLGEIVEVKITGTAPWILKGELL